MTLEQFLVSVERKAFRMTCLSVKNPDDALDIVQDAMLKLVQHYSHCHHDEWRPLFYRLLENRQMDWHRDQSRRQRRFFWFDRAGQDDEADGEDELDNLAAEIDFTGLMPPDKAAAGAQAIAALEAALQTLPFRQQQVFLLRVWEGFDVRETAQAMQCTEGTVKTHFNRAVIALRQQLEGHWP